MTQQDRNVVAAMQERAVAPRHLIRDRDTKFSSIFDPSPLTAAPTGACGPPPTADASATAVEPTPGVRDLVSGEDLTVTAAEDVALWEWAVVEVLRHRGVRIEEPLELTHLNIRQYQRPNGEVIAVLVIAPSKTDRERVIR